MKTIIEFSTYNRAKGKGIEQQIKFLNPDCMFDTDEIVHPCKPTVISEDVTSEVIYQFKLVTKHEKHGYIIPATDLSIFITRL